MLWNKVYASKDQAIFVGPSRKPRNRSVLEVASNLYLPAEKVRTTRQLLRCSIKFSTVGNSCLEVERPFHFTSSIHFFAEHFETVRSGAALAAYSVQLCNLRVTRSADNGHGRIVADVQDKSCSKMFDLQHKAQAPQIEGRQQAGEIHNEQEFQRASVAIDDDGGDVDDDDEEYGLSLLREHVAADLGQQNISEEVAVAASFAEASADAEGGVLDEVAVREMVEQVAARVDSELDLMCQVEQEVFQQAVLEKNLSMEELQPQVDRLMSQGMSADEAVFEAALNSSKLLGNVASSMGSGAAEPSAGSSSSSSTTPADASLGLGPNDSAGQHFRMTSKQMSERCYVTFCAAFSESFGALFRCLHACATSKPDPTGISLAQSVTELTCAPSFPGSCRTVLISWEVPGRTGRVARADTEGRLVSMVCVGANRTARDLSHCRMIHPNIGIAMERVRKKERAEIPSFILRMAKMFLQAESLELAEAESVIRELDEGLTSDPWGDVARAGEECVSCGKLERLPEVGSSSGLTGVGGLRCQQTQATSLATQCPLCLQAWHVECCDHFTEQFASSLQQIQLHPAPETQREPWQHEK